MDGFPTLLQVEDMHIGQALVLSCGNMKRASRMLGIDRRTLYRRVNGTKQLVELMRAVRKDPNWGSDAAY